MTKLPSDQATKTMANDFGQEQHAMPEAPKEGFVKLVYKGEAPIIEDEGFYEFSPKPVGKLGQADISLLYLGDFAAEVEGWRDETSVYLSSSGVELISNGEAMRRGLYYINVEVKNESERIRNVDMIVGVSLNDERVLLEVDMRNEEEDREKADTELQQRVVKHESAIFFMDEWRLVDNIHTEAFSYAYVDYKLGENGVLEDLGFKFNVIGRKVTTSGGDV